MEAGAGLLPNLEDRKPFDVLDIIEEYKKHPAPKRNPKSKLSKVDLSRLNRLAADPIAKVSLADESILVSYAAKSSAARPTTAKGACMFEKCCGIIRQNQHTFLGEQSTHGVLLEANHDE